MTSITLRNVKGSALTFTEVDNNFTNLNTDKAELASPSFTGQVVATSSTFDPNANRATAIKVTGPYGGGITFDDTGLWGIWASETGIKLNIGKNSGAGYAIVGAFDAPSATMTVEGRIFGRGFSSNNGLGKIIVQQSGSPPEMSQGDICLIW
jgi:hypothetical protein